jgi:ribosomal-protein-alanine N-acetyltransferase
LYAETKHLLIRDPVLEDWRGAYNFLADSEVMRWIHLGPKPFSEEQSRKWIEDLIFYNSQLPRDSHNSVIEERETHQIIGWIGIGKPSPHRLEIGDLDFGYALARTYWSKGYMTEALQAVLAFAFKELDANRVFAICEIQNIGSFRVMEKAGMKRQQQFIEYDSNNAHYRTMFLYAFSKVDWQMNSLPPP